jgi:hypothetical protein
MNFFLSYNRYFVSISLLFIQSGLLLFAQGEIDTQKRVFYRNEKTLAFVLNSASGLGGNYCYGKRINATVKTLYEVQFEYIKHPKEQKAVSYYGNQANSFIYGKLNSFYKLSLGVGKQKELFEKADKGGISIRYSYLAGLDLGFLKPIYYYYIDESGTRIESKFDPDPYIIGKAPFYRGLDELSLVPGIYVKTIITFEFGKKDRIINALEGGVALDAFIKPIEIMATEENRQLYVLLYLNYRFGWVKDPKKNPHKNKIDKILTE